MNAAQTLLEQIEAHPLTAEIRSRQAAETLLRRHRAAQALENLAEQEKTEIPILKEKIESTEARLKLWETHKESLLIELNAGRLALAQSAIEFSLDRNNHEALLFETADPQIDAAMEFFRGKLDELCQPGTVRVIGRAPKLNIYTDKWATLAETNQGAVLAAMSYCRAAIKELERMKYIPEVDAERIQALKTGIPSIDQFTESHGSRNYARFPNFALDAKIALESAANYLDVVTSKLLQRKTR